MATTDQAVSPTTKSGTVLGLIGDQALLDDFTWETRAELLRYSLDRAYDALDSSLGAIRARGPEPAPLDLFGDGDIPY